MSVFDVGSSNFICNKSFQHSLHRHDMNFVQKQRIVCRIQFLEKTVYHEINNRKLIPKIPKFDRLRRNLHSFFTTTCFLSKSIKYIDFLCFENIVQCI